MANPRHDWNVLLRQLEGAEDRLGLVAPDSPSHPVSLEAGLTDMEVEAIQYRYGFRFPPDYRALLQTALLTGDGFPRWCDGRAELDEWGIRPESPAEARSLAAEHLEDVPKLIPVFSHRMISEDPHAAGNAVLSVMQTDIIVYGVDFESCLYREFGIEQDQPPSHEPRAVPFWSQFVE